MSYVNQMLMISTGNVSAEDREKLIKSEGIVFYEKSWWGWFIYVSPEADKEEKEMPSLHQIMDYARGLGCEWICLDCDIEPDDSFEIYD